MFEYFVALYRAVGCPDFIDGRRVHVRVKETAEINAAIAAYNQRRLVDIFDEIDLDKEDGYIEFDLKIPNSSAGAFFKNIVDFVGKTPSLTKGHLRDNFYIRDIDYFSGDSEAPAEVVQLRNLVYFLWSLREFVSISIDREQAMEGNKLIFLKPADGKSHQKAILLKISLTEEVLKTELPSFRILAAIKNASDKEETQIEERVLLMNTAIAEIVDECHNDEISFEYLVKNWGRVNKKYLHDLHTYLNGFSFDALRKKISDSVVESTTKINNALGELGTKILAIPLSFGALIALQEAKSDIGFFFGAFGVFVGLYVIFRTIDHYNDQLRNLIEIFDFTLKATSLPQKSFNSSISRQLDRIKEFVDSQKLKIRRTINSYKLFVFTPFLFFLFIVFDRYEVEIKTLYSIARYCGDNYYWWRKLTSYFIGWEI